LVGKKVKNGDHHQIWELIGRVLQRLIIRNKTLLLSKLEFAAEEYAKRPIKNSLVFLKETAGLI
jgi:hypothetical protein